MNQNPTNETGDAGERSGLFRLPRPGGRYAATQPDVPQQGQEVRRDHATPPLPSNTARVTMLKRAQVENMLQLSRSAIYARMDQNSDTFDASFPTPVRYGNAKSVFWIAEEVSAWLDEQIRRARGMSNDVRSRKRGGAA